MKIKYKGKEYEVEYLGDAVYALFDGYGIWLHANSHDKPTDRIYIEDMTLANLITFVNSIRDRKLKFVNSIMERKSKEDSNK